MATNGFHRTAPVLPAMGLHSFHMDSYILATGYGDADYSSPPFAGAATSDHVLGSEPDYFALDIPSRANPVSPFRDPHTDGMHTARPSSVPMPIPQRGFAPNGPVSPRTAQKRDQRIPTAAEDEHLSTSRSRQLGSGYRLGFGDPPSPVTRSSSQERDTAPPSRNGDSPPLTDPSPELERLRLESDSGTLRDIARMASSNAQNMTKRRSSISRDRDSGYDALNGLNDGEADLDESAPQAAFGTEAYLKAVGGEAGAYHFPRHRLRKTMKGARFMSSSSQLILAFLDESKIPIVIVACGSFSPPTYLHLRMFEMAKDEIVQSQTYEIMAGYYSPVSSYYKKAGLAPAIDRVRMCELAVEHTSTWLMVDPWEAGQSEYKRTAIVLDHFYELLNQDEGGLVMSDGRKRKYKVMLLAGGDLIESFGEPGVWSEPDLHIILGRFGCLIVERAGSDVWAFLISHDVLYHHRRNVIVIKQLIYNDISSTKVRLFVRRGMSIKYLLPNSVIQYIYDHKLYREPDTKAVAN